MQTKNLGKNCDLTRIRTQGIRTEVQCANHCAAGELTIRAWKLLYISNTVTIQEQNVNNVEPYSFVLIETNVPCIFNNLLRLQYSS